MKRLSQLALAGLLSIGCTGCLGTNATFEGLRDWNEEVTDNRWANEGIFVGLNLTAAYPLAYLGDILVFNAIEWWTGNNPMEGVLGN